MKKLRRRIFCFPGLGADARMYRDLHFEKVEKVALDWIVPLPQESLSAYVVRVLQPFDPQPEDIMLGVSFGGPAALEASRAVGDAPVVFISTLKLEQERPVYFSFFQRVPLHQWLPARWIKRLGTIVPPPQRAGIRREEYDLFLDMVHATDNTFMRWALHQILHWKNQVLPHRYVHLHGDRDLLFPIDRIRNPIIIRRGTHFMIVRQAQLIHAHVQSFIDELPEASQSEPPYDQPA